MFTFPHSRTNKQDVALGSSMHINVIVINISVHAEMFLFILCGYNIINE